MFLLRVQQVEPVILVSWIHVTCPVFFSYSNAKKFCSDEYSLILLSVQCNALAAHWKDYKFSWTDCMSYVVCRVSCVRQVGVVTVTSRDPVNVWVLNANSSKMAKVTNFPFGKHAHKKVLTWPVKKFILLPQSTWTISQAWSFSSYPVLSVEFEEQTL